MKLSLLTAAPIAIALAACGSAPDSGPSVGATHDELSGCHGTASSGVPSSGDYFLTSFGDTPSDDGIMACGEYTKHGSWYYAASRQRYGCGSHVRIEANGKCVVAETDDYGPDACVERAAGEPIIDASPLVSEHLFGTSSAGWSDRLAVHVTEVDASTPLGPCDGAAGGSSGSGGGSGSGSSATCHSATLGADEPAGTCVQSRSDGAWYQCTAGGWESGGASGTGPVGACASMHPL